MPQGIKILAFRPRRTGTRDPRRVTSARIPAGGQIVPRLEFLLPPSHRIESTSAMSAIVDEGNETVTNCNGLKMIAAAGKKRMTGVADTEQLLRLI